MGLLTRLTYNFPAIGLQTSNLDDEQASQAIQTLYKGVMDGLQKFASVVNAAMSSVDYGSTGARPSGPRVGNTYFDVTLNKPVWWNGTHWVDATGTNV